MKQLYIFGEIYPYEIDAQYVQDFLNKLKAKEEFEVVINSPGGSVFEGIAIYNLLKPYNPTMRVIGQASSIASVIAMAGTVEIAETAFMLIHNPWTMTMGDSTYMKKVAAKLDTVKSSIMKSYANKTGKDTKELSNIMDAETFYSAEEAVQNNFADQLIKPSKEDTKALGMYEIAALNKKINNDLNDGQDSITNEGGDMPNFEVENVKLKAQIETLETNSNKLISDNTKYKKEISDNKEIIKNAGVEKATLTTDLDKSKADLKVANEAIAEFKGKQEESVVENFLVSNIAKIKPTDKDDLKAELLMLKNNPEMKIGEITLYDKKCKEIEALPVMKLDQTMDEPDLPDNVQMKGLDFNSTDPIMLAKINVAMIALAKKDKITENEALEQLQTLAINEGQKDA